MKNERTKRKIQEHDKRAKERFIHLFKTQQANLSLTAQRDFYYSANDFER